MKSFKEYADCKNLQSLNERLFGKVLNGTKVVPVYINPTISDLETILHAGSYQIRGLTKDQYIFVWGTDQGYHRDISKALGEIDPDLVGEPDICFYLDVEGRNAAVSSSTLSFYLTYSSFTGKSIKVGDSYAQLQRLMQYPAMQKLAHSISNIDEIIHPEKFNPYYKNRLRHPEHDHEQPPAKLFDPSQYSHNDAMWNQKDKKPQNPYRWRSGLHRVGD